METFEYHAHADGSDHGIEIVFLSATNAVYELAGTAYKGETTSTNTKILTAHSGNHVLEIVNGKYATIELNTTESDWDFYYFIDGDQIKTSDSDFVTSNTSNSNLVLIKTTGEEYVSEFTTDDIRRLGSLIQAKAKWGSDYMLTIQALKNSDNKPTTSE